MRDCVLSFVAAMTPLAAAAPLASPFTTPFRAAPSQPAVSNELPKFQSPRLSGLSPVTGDAAPMGSLVLADDLDSSRTVAFWSALDLGMGALRDRVESSPLLRDGLMLGHDAGLVPTEILALRN